jgi:hypothetical protein
MNDHYERGLYWILRERRGLHGGWPPRDVGKVSGWAVVKMLAAMSNRSPRAVAQDVIDHSIALESPHGEP